MDGPSGHGQILIAQDHQVERPRLDSQIQDGVGQTQDGFESKGGFENKGAAETAHRHQPSSRRGFQGRWPAHLRAISRPRHRGGHPRSGAGACDPAGRALQSGGSLKAALSRRRIPDGLCAQGLGEDLHGRAGRDPDERGQRLDPTAAHQASDHGLFRRRRIAGSDPAGGVQDGGVGDVGRFTSAPPRSRPSGTSSACPRRSTSIPAH